MDDPRSATRSAATAVRRGRWIWVVSAVATAAAVIAMAATAIHVRKVVHFGVSIGGKAPWTSTYTKTVTVRQPATTIDVHDYGGPVMVSAGAQGGIQVTEIMSYDKSRPPVQQSVANGQLTLADPACNGGPCSVAFHVMVPAGTSARLESDGGPIMVAGLTARVDADSGGGPLTARGVSAPLTARSGGGAITITGPAGPVDADSGGGPLIARSVSGGLTAETGGGGLNVVNESGPLAADTGGGPADATGIAGTDVTVSTAGGGATLALIAVPHRVQADSGGGPLTLQVPGGSYAVSADSGGGPQDIGIATDPASPDKISLSSGGGGISVR